MKRDTASIGFIGIPDDAIINKLELELGKPVKKIKKDGKIILLIGRGLFKKKFVIPFEK
jgi:hypothetical protein